eukprot:jgi/Tetstr1/455545/TSEL_042367.t1
MVDVGIVGASAGGKILSPEDSEAAFERAALEKAQAVSDEDDGYSDEFDQDQESVNAAPSAGRSHAGGDPVGPSYDSPSLEIGSRWHPYSSPYRQSQDTFGAGRNHANGTQHSLNLRVLEDHSSMPSPSPTGPTLKTRRPQSARSRPDRQSAADASDTISFPAPGPYTTMNSRLKRVLQGIMQRDPRSWDVAEVRYWLDFVGLSRHRDKFSQNSVDGRTLVKLTDEALRKYIGIHSPGHRLQILEYIEDLKECVGFQESPAKQQPSSAPPANTVSAHPVTTIDHVTRLKRELEKASQRAAQQDSLAEEAVWHAKLAHKEVESLRKQLAAVRREAQRAGLGTDAAEKPEWQPLGKNTSKTHWDPNPK